MPNGGRQQLAEGDVEHDARHCGEDETVGERGHVRAGGGERGVANQGPEWLGDAGDGCPEQTLAATAGGVEDGNRNYDALLAG